MERSTSKTTTKSSVKELTVNGMLIALTLVFTAFINIRLPIMGNGGLIHLGNVPLFLGAIFFGKKTGFLAGAFGMGMFDLLSGWTAWAPFTFVIVGLMGFTVGAITEKKKTLPRCVAAMAAACVIKVVGYYFTEVILYSSWIVPFGSIPGNLVQIGVAAVITVAALPVFRGIVKYL